MTVKVNGRERTVAEGCTLRALLDHLGLRPEGVAVAIDGAVVPRGEHAVRVLSAGQSVEILRAVGGG